MNAENAEKNIWDQMRALTQSLVRMAQWSVTTLAGLQTALFFIRKDLREMLHVPMGQALPFRVWIVGFVMIVFVTTIFMLMTNWTSKRLRYYIGQLKALPAAYDTDTIKLYPEIPKDMTIRYYIRAVYIFFPLFDVSVYAAQRFLVPHS